jgi:hypothetical protein
MRPALAGSARASSQQRLEAIYRELTACKSVLMVL